MAAPVPDRSRVIYREEDVTPSGGLKPNDAYDLVLYEELGNPSRGVLVVSAVLQFQFQSGKGTLGALKGKPLDWTPGEKAKFVEAFKKACRDVWSNQHVITTTSGIPKPKTVSVLFEIGSIMDGWNPYDHWELGVKKTDAWDRSSVTIFTGNAKIDSLDVTPAMKGAAGGQRGAAHEFGHMIGLRDEYPDADDNTFWTTDVESIMHSGETVRPRHYAMLADWITKQYGYLAQLAREPVSFKVGGSVDLHNAGL